MKNIVHNLKVFIINYYFAIILSFLLIMSLYSNVNMRSKLSKYQSGIYGTYSRQGQSMDEIEYFVFEKDKFYHYISFKLLDKGDYNKIYENVYSLKGSNELDYFIIKGVLEDNEVIYFNDNDLNNINVYSKISDVPTFINIDIKK